MMYLTARLRACDFLESRSESVAPAALDSIPTPRRTLKLPTIELPKFNGNVREWLPFWSVFRKIHEDPLIRREDKFQYLIQATVPDSRARDVVSSFPPTSENYEKVITSLKSRFGRDEVVVEFYVRELLGLVLQNAVKGYQRASLANIYDKLEAYIRALDTLGVTTDKCAAMLYPLVESSLPEEVLRAWQRNGQHKVTDANGQNDTKDRLTKLLEFLQMEVENQERIDMALQGFGLPAEAEKIKKSRNKTETTKTTASASALLTSEKVKQLECLFCKSSHESKDCEVARKMNLSDRKECVRKANACFTCLRAGHISKFCRGKVSCAWCGKRHVLLVCTGFASKDDTAKSNLIDNSKVVENSLATFCVTPKVYLQTLLVKACSGSCEKIVRAVIDTASHRSYIRSDLAKELGYVPHGEVNVEHSLFGGVKSKAKKYNTFLVHLKNLDESYACNFSVLSQDTICDTIPCIKRESWVDELSKQNIFLSDAGNQQDLIAVMIGADVAGKLITGKKYNLSNGLSAFETLLGWTVMGKLSKNDNVKSDATVMLTTMFVREANVSDLWRLDILGITDPIQSRDESIKNEYTRNFVRETSKINLEGRYEVRLPWKDDHAPLPENYDVAEQRLKSTIVRLNKKDVFRAYNGVFESWLAEDIIERVPEEEISRAGHYLPHRPVIKMNSTTKIRPVFDASARKRGNPSLNQCLEKGPNLLDVVPSHLNRFREKQIGVISDIKGAFLQIVVNPTDRDFLRFLWLVDGKIAVFRHRRVVFGLSCSPFLLAAVIEMLLESASEKAKKNDEILWTENSVRKLKESFYVDNCVTSVSSLEELQAFSLEATAIMAAGGFELRGWEQSGEFSEKESSLVLGISWNKRKDTISVNPAVVDIDKPKIVTKRAILSATHKIFDPIGFTCPVSLQPKIFLKQLWKEKIDWDTEINDKRSEKFSIWLNELPFVKQIEIPRKLGDGSLSIHAFGDASGLAYAAAVFARIEYGDFVDLQLLSARSRIAPEKASIPRLELMAASIATRLTNLVVKSLTRHVESVTYWSDSTTVLAWLKRDTQWGIFVYNRIREIRLLSNEKDWKFVPSELNPADMPSRGCSPSQLVKSEWWRGPSWLRAPECDWPSVKQKVDEKEVNSEIKKSAVVAMINTKSSEFIASDYFSTYTKLLRFLAWARRFLKNRRLELERHKITKRDDTIEARTPGNLYLSQVNRKKLCLSFKEIKEAEISLLKHLQNVMFQDTSKDKLSSFKTFVNEDGLYVLKTKILNRNDDGMFLCPILLDKHDIVNLLVRETHVRCGHSGTQLVMNTLREKFWIISLRQITRSIVTKCVTCKKHKAKHMICETPPLPVNRVRDSAVFEVTGIDFAGPLFIKGGGKGWICIFTCAVYRAVHFELASSLSTDGFIECLRRFVARRGRPQYIYSDNGTNFCSTAKALEGLDWEIIIKRASVLQIEWRFNPPSAPWWGGWWERLIGVLKTILRKILGKASLSYECLTTSLCDAEAIINSRPLTYVSEDSNDFKPLTPAMFLQEIRETGVPDLDMLYNERLNKKFKYRQRVLNDLRARFRTEYLSQLLLKNGKKETRNINIGDVVLIGNDTQKRIDWPLGRIVDLIVGRDGNTRVCILKTKNGLLKRPIQRVYPLEITIDDNDFVKDITDKFQDMKNSVIENNAKANENPNAKRCSHKAKDSRSDNKEKVFKTRSGRTVQRRERFMY